MADGETAGRPIGADPDAANGGSAGGDRPSEASVAVDEGMLERIRGRVSGGFATEAKVDPDHDMTDAGSDVEPPDVEGFGALREIGVGGFSRVFEAMEFEFRRWVAIKVRNDPLESEDGVAQFERECRLLGVLSRHPHVVTVFSSAFSADGRPAIVMELFRAGSYMDVVRQSEPLGVGELLAVGVGVSGALGTAHAQGVVHGDVKPHNVFRSEFGSAVLGDFGIASLMHLGSMSGRTQLSLYYAAPELVEIGASASSPFADQYSLAATMHALGTGSRPYDGGASDTTETVLERMVRGPAPRLGPPFPASLADVLSTALAPEPHERFRDMAEFAAALGEIERDQGLDPTPLLISGGESRFVGRTTGARSLTPVTPRDPGTELRPIAATAAPVDASTGGSDPPTEQSQTVFRPIAPTPAAASDPSLPSGHPKRRPRWIKFAAAGTAALALAAVIGLTTLRTADGADETGENAGGSDDDGVAGVVGGSEIEPPDAAAVAPSTGAGLREDPDGGSGLSDAPADASETSGGCGNATGRADEEGVILVAANVRSLSDIATAASMVSAGLGDAVLFAEQESLTASASAVIEAIPPDKVLFVGGVAALSQNIGNEILELTPSVVIERLAGRDRAHTAACAARLVLGDATGGTLVLANDSSDPDVGIAASVVATGDAEALLFADMDELGAATSAILEEHGPDWVWLVGGTSVFSPDMNDEVRRAVPDARVVRLAGEDRFTTAAESAVRAFDEGATTAVIANASGLDAAHMGIAAAFAAARGSTAVLYAGADEIPVAAENTLKEYLPARVLLIGGEAHLSSSVWESVADAVPDAEVVRVCGATTLDIAAKITLLALGGEISQPPGECAAPEPEPVVPGAVSGLLADGRAVSWVPPKDDGGSTIIGYRVSYANASSTTTDPAFVLPAGLAAGTYSVEVRAYNGVGDGPSESVEVRVARRPASSAQRPASAPGAVSGLLAEGRAVSWVRPGSDGGASLIGYRVSYADVRRTTTATSFTLPADLPAGMYSVEVRAYNRVGDSPPRMVEVRVGGRNSGSEPPLPGVPGAVSDLRADGRVVTWAPPGDQGDSAVIGYRISYSVSGTAVSRIRTATSFTLPDHYLPGSYSVEVRAYNRVGNGPPHSVNVHIAPSASQ